MWGDEYADGDKYANERQIQAYLEIVIFNQMDSYELCTTDSDNVICRFVVCKREGSTQTQLLRARTVRATHQERYIIYGTITTRFSIAETLLNLKEASRRTRHQSIQCFCYVLFIWFVAGTRVVETETRGASIPPPPHQNVYVRAWTLNR